MKRKQSKSVSQVKMSAKAVSILSKMEDHLFALEDLGRMYAVAGGDSYTFVSIAEGIVAKIERCLKDCLNVVKRADWQDARPVVCSQDAIANLHTFLDAMKTDEDSKEHGRMVGEVTRMYVARLGRDMERAVQAFGGNPMAGYLQGYLMEQEDMQQVTGDDNSMLRLYRCSNGEGKEMISSFAKVTHEKHHR
jgi:hypothetical protein